MADVLVAAQVAGAGADDVKADAPAVLLSAWFTKKAPKKLARTHKRYISSDRFDSADVNPSRPNPPAQAHPTLPTLPGSGVLNDYVSVPASVYCQAGPRPVD